MTSYNKRLHDIIIKNKDGFTYGINLKPSQHKKGYYIAITNNSNNDIYKAIQNITSKKRFIQFLKFLYIGGWIDEHEKKYYLDLTIHNNNLKFSLFIARLFKQKAIYDIKNNKSIYLNDFCESITIGDSEK